MKKKQKQKLLKQFRPSLDGIRTQLFRSLEEESLRHYWLPLQVMLDPKNRQVLIIGLAGQANEGTRINVLIDGNFTAVLKRIRSGESTIFERFRDNILIEIVSYWNDQRMKKDQPTAQPVATPVTNDASVKETPTKEIEKIEVASQPVSEEATTDKKTNNEKTSDEKVATDSLTLDDFIKQVAEYPKFTAEKTADTVVINQTVKDDTRKLAEISMSAVNEFTIEKALERKYKVKLTLVPLIEQFAATPINER